FPNMIVGDTNRCLWPYLRREIPHNWYIDKSHPAVGFVSRDEAHILYNTALKFKGKNALEIGCWLGWSACHLALGGVELDVIDPLLERPDFYESVNHSLQAVGVINSVKLIPGCSPEKVEELAAQFQRKWSLIYIDGNHDSPGPLYDAIACEKYAQDDALILFHDLVSPDVAQGLDYLKQRGWQTMIYQTMQIMGVAWRGNIEPVIHQPDPNIQWHLPEHLQHYPVSCTLSNNTIGELEFSPTNHFINSVEKVSLARAEEKLSHLQKSPLQEELNLKEINLIIFPDWTQPEELLLADIESIIRVLLTHPERSYLNLLVETSNTFKEQADLTISSVVMKLLYEEDLDIAEQPEISLFGNLSKIQWKALHNQIHSRIRMKNENRLTITEAGMERLPFLEIDSFSKQKTFRLL
ncbi:MAG TPA: hypothetical protein DCP31_22300, partial [Cyanobacteria bacterium UBA8543]|nr:hypothetical protein [Cyanobacteria bacterium UBA8543]